MSLVSVSATVSDNGDVRLACAAASSTAQQPTEDEEATVDVEVLELVGSAVARAVAAVDEAEWDSAAAEAASASTAAVEQAEADAEEAAADADAASASADADEPAAADAGASSAAAEADAESAEGEEPDKVIRNLDTGEIFAERESIRNLDTGEIMSVDELERQYTGAPENAFDWVQRRARSRGRTSVDASDVASASASEAAAAAQKPAKRLWPLPLSKGGERRKDGERSKDGDDRGGPASPSAGGLLRSASRSWLSSRPKTAPTDAPTAQQQRDREAAAAATQVIMPMFDLEAAELEESAALCARVADGCRELADLAAEAHASGAVRAADSCHAELLEGCTVLVELAVHEQVTMPPQTRHPPPGRARDPARACMHAQPAL